MTLAVRLVRGLWLPVVIFVSWWYLSSGSTSGFFPPLSESVDTFRHVWFFDRFFTDLLPTVYWFYAGLAIGAFAGVVLGIIMGLMPRVRRDLMPMTEFVRAIPTAGLVPLALLLLGAGFWMQTLLGAIAVFFQILIGTIDAVRGIDPVNLEVARCYGLSRTQRLRRIILPAATPQIMASARIGISIGLAAVVIANMVASGRGLGFYLVDAQTAYDMRAMWAGLFMIGILGYLVNVVFLLFQHRILAWHRGWRATSIAAK